MGLSSAANVAKLAPFPSLPFPSRPELNSFPLTTHNNKHRHARYELRHPFGFGTRREINPQSFLWVAVFSFLISTIVETWVEKTPFSCLFFGLYLVSIGAEVPDCIQSVTVARRGYGSMAISNCTASQ